MIGKKTPASLVSPISGSLRPGRTGRLLASLSVLKRRPSGWIPGTAYARSPKTRARFGDPPFRDVLSLRAPPELSRPHFLLGLALGRLHVCVCARVLSFPRTSRGCVRRIHAPERIPHLRVTLRSRAGTTPDSRPLPNTPLQGSLGKNWVRKIPLAPLY